MIPQQALAAGTMEGRVTLKDQGDGRILSFAGEWTLEHGRLLDRRLRDVPRTPSGRIIFDLSEVSRLDTAGAWLIHRTAKTFQQVGTLTEFTNLSPAVAKLLDRVRASDCRCDIAPPRKNYLLWMLNAIGSGACRAIDRVAESLGFLGIVLVCLVRSLGVPQRLRLTSVVHHMEQVGLNAMPIVALISFLIGIVLAYMGALQLTRFGASVFVVDLLEVAVLRELGILLTAILVAGRSGSAFTAQIGSMKIREEVDAMRTMGMDPVEVLVVPRVLALLITLPMLGFVADLAGLLGGGLMTWTVLDIGPATFLERLRDALNLRHFAAGLIKAPFFALAIGLIGCLLGFKVSGSSESVGRLTTQAVVEAIFTVIVLDAGFAVFFSAIDF